MGTDLSRTDVDDKLSTASVQAEGAFPASGTGRTAGLQVWVYGCSELCAGDLQTCATVQANVEVMRPNPHLISPRHQPKTDFR